MGLLKITPLFAVLILSSINVLSVDALPPSHPCDEEFPSQPNSAVFFGQTCGEYRTQQFLNRVSSDIEIRFNHAFSTNFFTGIFHGSNILLIIMPIIAIIVIPIIFILHRRGYF